MKKIWTLVLVAFLVSALLGISQAQMYWTPGEDRAPSAQADEPGLDFGRDIRAPSFKDKEIYDYEETETIDPEAEAVQPAPARRVEPRPRAVEEPRPVRVTPSARERSVSPRSSTTQTRPTLPTVRPDEKKQAPTSVTAAPDSAQKKKMQWGRVEVKPIEPDKNKKKLQWGKPESKP